VQLAGYALSAQSKKFSTQPKAPSHLPSNIPIQPFMSQRTMTKSLASQTAKKIRWTRGESN